MYTDIEKGRMKRFAVKFEITNERSDGAITMTGVAFHTRDKVASCCLAGCHVSLGFCPRAPLLFKL